MITFVNLARHPWGAEQSMLLLAEGLMARGVAAELVCGSPVLARMWMEATGVTPRLLSLDLTAGRAVRNKIAFGVVRALPPKREVVLWTYDVLPGAATARTLRPDLRLILDLHDRIRGSRGQALLRFFARGCDAVVANSYFTGEYIASPKPFTIYRPVAAYGAPAKAGRTRGRRLRVGLVGRVEPRKEPEVAIIAVALHAPEIDLVIRGGADPDDDDYRNRLESVARSMAPSTIVFEDRVPPDRALADIDALLVTSSVEAMGRTVIEAQMAGIPVVVPDTGGASELVIDGVTGLKFKAGNARSLAAILGRLSRDRDLYARLGSLQPEQIVGTDPVHYAAAFLTVLDGVRS